MNVNEHFYLYMHALYFIKTTIVYVYCEKNEHFFKHSLFMLCHFIQYVKKNLIHLKFAFKIQYADDLQPIYMDQYVMYAGDKTEYLLMHVEMNNIPI